jgi:hypothetical protein
VKVESGNKIINEDVQVLDIDGKSTNNPQAIASAFNEYFLSLVANIYLNNNNNIDNDDNINNKPIYYLSHAFNTSYPNINLKFITTKEIQNITKSPKPKNAHGYDEISTNLLKTSSVYISSALNHICNKSLSSGILSSTLKIRCSETTF